MLLPEIKHTNSPTPQQRVLDLHIPVGLTHFSGHFPGLPLLPGVVQVDWATRWGQEFFKIEGEFLSLDNLKFQAMIFPGDNIRLELDWHAEKGQLSFAYTSSDAQGKAQTLSSGRVSFAKASAA